MNTLPTKTSKTVNENAETVRDAKGTASSVQIMNTRLAPIFAKVKEKSKPLESAGKAKKKKDNTAKIEKNKKQKVASKASKELKPINGNSTEGSKKDRRVEAITCVTILDDDSDDVVMTKENNLGTSQKRNTNKKDYGSHGKMIPSRSSTSKKVHIERVDYAPFSSFGHIGLVSDAESSDVPRAAPYLRLQKRSSAFVHSELRRPLTFGDSRDWFAER
ncbi:unnamed protein product, partial [Anisakis simplex]|uniref:Uncharacterized protein n=1 Tax=Anisakis simplex TaxID=6269 RepID=A0A0M3JD98_ANISI